LRYTFLKILFYNPLLLKERNNFSECSVLLCNRPVYSFRSERAAIIFITVYYYSCYRRYRYNDSNYARAASYRTIVDGYC